MAKNALKISIILMIFSILFSRDALNDIKTEQEKYVDSITGFAFLIPLGFEYDRSYYPAFFEGEKKGQKTDNIFLDKIFREISFKETIEDIKKSMEDKSTGLNMKEPKEFDLKGRKAMMTSFKYARKIKNSSLETNVYILLVKMPEITVILQYGSMLLDEKASQDVFDKIISSVSFEAPTKIVHSFFSPKLSEINKLIGDKKTDNAENLIKDEMKKYPYDAGLLFVLGTIYVKSKKEKEAARYFNLAFEKGYCDFSGFFEENYLEEFYEKQYIDNIFQNKKNILKEGRNFLLSSLRKELASYYEIKIPESNVIMFTDIKDNAAIKILKESISTTVNFAKADLDLGIPFYPIIWVLSDNRDINKAMIGALTGSSANIGGVYVSSYGLFFTDKKTGYGTFVHEYMHVLHHGDENALNQYHPRWISEMLSTVYEELKWSEAEEKILIDIMSGRYYTLKDAISTGKTISIKQLVKMSDKEIFKNENIGLFYASVRYVGLFLREKNLLGKFYDEYRKGYAKDKTGEEALKKTTGMDLDKLEEEWEEWVISLD